MVLGPVHNKARLMHVRKRTKSESMSQRNPRDVPIAKKRLTKQYAINPLLKGYHWAPNKCMLVYEMRLCNNCTYPPIIGNSCSKIYLLLVMC